jgi:aromatic ring-opening dioxygenase catalytic subunit (LigB family)
MTICCDQRADEMAQLEAARKLRDAITAAILAVASGKQSYQLDTGQTRLLVTKANLTSLRDMRSELLNEIRMLEVSLGCGGSTHIAPGF